MSTAKILTLKRVPRKGKRYHHGNLPEALKSAATRLIATKGVEGFTLRDAAAAAGVSGAAPYRHFADRDALLAAIALDAAKAIGTEMREAAEAVGENPLFSLREAGRVLAQFANDHPAHFTILFGAHLHERNKYPELLVADRENFDYLVNLIRRNQKAGFVRDGDPFELGLAALSLVTGIANAYISGAIVRYGANPKEAPGYIRRLADLLYEGLAPRAQEFS